MKLYVMRHGQTDWNVLRKLQGCTDINLNAVGIEQAKQAKEKLNQYDIDLILCSPLKRTRKTAEIVNEDKQVPIVIENRIIERHYGQFEGVNPEEVGVENNFWDYQANLNCKNVEPVVEICNRVWGFLEEIKEKYQEKNVLLITHGGTAKVINSYFEGIGEDGILPKANFQNCEIREYKWEKAK